MAEQTPDSIITTQRNGQTIVAELFFNHSSTETFRDKLLKLALADSSRLSASDGQEPEKNRNLAITAAPTIHTPCPGSFYLKILIFSKSRAGKNTRKKPLLRNKGAERRVYENRAYEAGKDYRHLV